MEQMTKSDMYMPTHEITVELNLKNIIAESREVAQALNEFANDLERIEKKYQEKIHELNKCKEELENQLNMSVQNVIEEKRNDKRTNT